MPGDEELTKALEESRALGFLGPGPVHDQVAHAEGFASALGGGSHRVLDLGSGGGLPGLVLAVRMPGSAFTLLDVSRRRAAFLVEAVRRLGVSGRVRVVRARAEDAGRQPELRGGFDAVVARAFGPPGVTAECAAPFLLTGGRLIVSEPPEEVERWPDDDVSVMGLRVGVRHLSNGSFQVLHQVGPCPERFPRPSGQPARRPLF